MHVYVSLVMASIISIPQGWTLIAGKLLALLLVSVKMIRFVAKGQDEYIISTVLLKNARAVDVLFP